MDMSAIIVVAILSAAFFGFVLWAAFHSRKSNSKEFPAGNAEIKFPQPGNKTNGF